MRIQFAAERPEDRRFMDKAIEEAAPGVGTTYPNPCVGAVLVRHGKIIAKARSGPTGQAHAEARVLAKAGAKAKGATLYVTLEPCSHFGRTPPCAHAIVNAQVARVVIGAIDPAPHVSGTGCAALVQGGVEVVRSRVKRARRLHAHYLWHLGHGRPYITLKAAISLDGNVATQEGNSRWISGAQSRRRAHRLRARHHGILVGVNTLLLDDPALTVRHCPGVDPVPIVLDSNLRAVAAQEQREQDFAALREGSIVLTALDSSDARASMLADRGVEVIRVPRDEAGRLDLEAVLDRLGQREFRSVLVEGGGAVLGSFVRLRRWNAAHLFVAPRWLGEGKRVISGFSPVEVEDGPRVILRKVRRRGEDLELYLRPNFPPEDGTPGSWDEVRAGVLDPVL